MKRGESDGFGFLLFLVFSLFIFTFGYTVGKGNMGVSLKSATGIVSSAEYLVSEGQSYECVRFIDLGWFSHLYNSKSERLRVNATCEFTYDSNKYFPSIGRPVIQSFNCG